MAGASGGRDQSDIFKSVTGYYQRQQVRKGGLIMYESLQQMREACEEKGSAFWELVMEEEVNEKQSTGEEVFGIMQSMYHAMVQADENYHDEKSSSGMVGGAGILMERWNDQEKTLAGRFLGQVMERALKMAESNACMKRIVAAPTAGSCGILPAVLITYHREENCPEEQIVQGLFVAAGIGGIIAQRASIAGAQGGCQAEIGSASAMAAGALTYLRGGNLQQIYDAVALALKGLLGLVCDPVAGLVEVPCVKRNVIGAVNAVTCSDMAMAGIQSFIPVDQVIDAMDEIGRNMPCQYRETSEGGLAATPAGKAVSL